jgi:hypothetical protein
MEFLGGAVVGAGVILIIWWVLQIVGNWKIFEKAGKPGWHSIVPFLNTYDEYDLCWNGGFGLLYLLALVVANSVSAEAAQESGMLTAVVGVAAVVALVLQIIESNKLAKSFGKGLGYTIFLIFFDRIARIILGFSDAKYIGKDL